MKSPGPPMLRANASIHAVIRAIPQTYVFYPRSDRSFSKAALSARPADWHSGRSLLLPAGTHAQPLRREGAPRRRAPRARQPDARVLPNRRGLAAAAASAESAARSNRLVVPHRRVRRGDLGAVVRAGLLRDRAPGAARDRLARGRGNRRRDVRARSRRAVPAVDADDRAAAVRTGAAVDQPRVRLGRGQAPAVVATESAGSAGQRTAAGRVRRRAGASSSPASRATKRGS